MGIAKRTLRVGKKELCELFGLPENVEIMAIRNARGWDDEEAFEFLLASPEEVEINGYKITVEKKDGDYGLVRRISLDTINRLQNGEELHTGGYVNGDIWNGQPQGILFFDNENGKAVPKIDTTPLTINVNIEEQKRDVSEVAKEIVKGLERINKKGGK